MPRPEFVLRRGRFHGVLRRGDRDRPRRGDWRAATLGGHTREITCMSMCAAETTLDGVTYPPLTLAATGQRKAVEDTETDEAEVPFVCVGHADVSRGGARSLSESPRAAAALGPPRRRRAHHGRLRRQPHRARVGWRARGVGEPRAHGGGLVGLIGQGAGFKSDRRACAASSGIRARRRTRAILHVGQKTRQDVDRGPSHAPLVLARHVLRRVRRGGYPRRGVSETSAGRDGRAGVTAGIVVGGCADGSLLLWRNGRAFRRVRAHARGPRTIQPDGTVAWGGGVRASTSTGRRRPAHRRGGRRRRAVGRLRRRARRTNHGTRTPRGPSTRSSTKGSRLWRFAPSTARADRT